MNQLRVAAIAVAWSLGCYLLLRVIVLLLATAGGRSLDLVALGAASALAYTLGAWAVIRNTASSARALALRPTHPLLLLVGLALGISLKLPAESLRSLTENYFPTSEEVIVRKAMLYRAHDVGQVLSLVLVVCLVAPLVEELFFRGALFGRALRASAVLAASLTGLLFVLAHDDPRDWPALASVAAALSLLRALGGSLLPCLALHVSFNSIGVLALVTGAASPRQPLDVSSTAVIASCLVAALLLAAAVRLSNTPEASRARGEDEP